MMNTNFVDNKHGQAWYGSNGRQVLVSLPSYKLLTFPDKDTAVNKLFIKHAALARSINERM